MGHERLDYTVASGVATIRLTRVEARNAMDATLKRELAEVVADAADDAEIRAVVVTGSGAAFCAGGDIEEMVRNDVPRNSRSRLRTLLAEVFLPLSQMEKPTIAAVNGHAHGSGLSLALACDLIVAAEEASMSCAYIKMGLVADCGALYFLPRRVPMTVAKELIFTGRRFSAAEAKELGLVNRVVPLTELETTVAELAAELASGPTVAIGMAKTILARSLHLGAHDLAELEAFAAAVAYSTEDHLAARTAFAAKAVPSFAGR